MANWQLFIMGPLLGVLSGEWVWRMICTGRQELQLPASKRSRLVWYLLATGVSLAATGLLWGALNGNWQATPEVSPSPSGLWWRAAYHLIFLELLITATLVDLDCYLIPDQITLPGTLIGLAFPLAIGEVQLAHWWSDWRLAVDQLQGPAMPAWFDQYRQLHGLLIAITGLLTGGLLIWLTRILSRYGLGYEAIGFGDVTLMMMVGSFLGWQGTILVFFLAPLLAIITLIITSTQGGRHVIPYGPFLSAAAVVILIGWGAVWQQVRLIFSDVWLVAGCLSAALATLLILCSMVRLYRSIPATSLNTVAAPSRLRPVRTSTPKPTEPQILPGSSPTDPGANSSLLSVKTDTAK